MDEGKGEVKIVLSFCCHFDSTTAELLYFQRLAAITIDGYNRRKYGKSQDSAAHFVSAMDSYT